MIALELCLGMANHFSIGIPKPYSSSYGHENEMYNVGLNLKEVECL